MAPAGAERGAAGRGWHVRDRRARQIVLRWDRDRDPLELRRREWLVTNGLGGYASGTLAGIPTRKYHGLFVPNLAAPKGRHIMISRCDESVVTPARQLHLGGAEFEDERFVGDSHRYLKEFRLDHRIAVWTFELDDVVLEKSVVMLHNQNTVCVQYRLLERRTRWTCRCGRSCRFAGTTRRRRARPAMRSSLEVRRGRHEIRHAGSPLVLRVELQPGPTTFMTDERDEHQFVYRVERDRGDPAFDSAFSPGYFAAQVCDRAASRVRRLDARLGSHGFRCCVACSMRSAAGSTACSRSRRSSKATRSPNSWRWPRISSSCCPAAASKKT